MPVRLVIQASSVSRKVARSALVSTAGGMHLPQPVMAAYVMGVSPVPWFLSADCPKNHAGAAPVGGVRVARCGLFERAQRLPALAPSLRR